MRYNELLQLAETKLIEKGIDKKTAKKDAEEIFISIFHCKKSDLITHKNQEAGEINAKIFLQAIDQRTNGKPVAYITHNTNFFNYDFFVNESCLIPRVDSEIIVENALNYAVFWLKQQNRKAIKILDACCGSGCLGISLAKSLIDKKLISPNNIELTLLDKSSPAIQVAKINLQKHTIKAKLMVADILTTGFGNDKYNIILCNPPYIETETIKTLDKEVRDFEPHMALDGGADGLIFYKSISNHLAKNLTEDSKAFFEIGYNQGKTAKEIFEKVGFLVEVAKDYGKQDRCLIVKIKH